MRTIRGRVVIRARLTLLGLRCALIGHDYGTHFSDMFSEPVDEVPWCSRCGRDQPKADRT